MEEKKLENIEEVTEEVAEDAEEVTEEITEEIKEEEAIEDMLEEEKEEDPYASVSQELDIPTYKSSDKKKKRVNKSIISLVLAVILAIGAIAYSGFGIYDAYMEYKGVLKDNTYDEVFKQEYVEIMDGYIADMRVASIIGEMFGSGGQNVPSSFKEMLEVQGKTLDEYFEENHDKIMEDFKDTYDKGHAEWKVTAEKEIFAPARKAVTKEIVDKSVVGLTMLAVAYLLFVNYKILKKNQY